VLFEIEVLNLLYFITVFYLLLHAIVITDINYFANGYHLRLGTEDSCVRSKLQYILQKFGFKIE
jgi:hypothetical protein